MKNKKNQQAGFGLIEVIVSITIMTMVLLALNELSRSAYYSWENASNKAAAYNLIQEEMENLHNIRDTNAVTSGVTSWDAGISNSTQNNIQVGNIMYNETVTVAYVPVIGLADKLKKKVTVMVIWQERLGTRSLAATTYLTDWKPRY